MKTVLSLLLLVGVSVAAFAQSATPAGTPPQCPPGPLLNPVPDNMQWTVTSNAASEGQTPADTPGASGAKPTPKPPAAKTVVGQSVGEIRHVVTTYGNGSKMDVWKKSRAKHAPGVPVENSKIDVWEKGGSQYVMSTGWSLPVISEASPDDLYENLGWISPRNFQNIVKYNGADCMVFRDKVLPPGVRVIKQVGPLTALTAGYTPPPTVAPVDPETLKVTAIAVIELDRRLPATVQMGSEVTHFSFQPLDPLVVLTLPPEVDTALTARIQRTQAAVRRSVDP